MTASNEGIRALKGLHLLGSLTKEAAPPINPEEEMLARSPQYGKNQMGISSYQPTPPPDLKARMMGQNPQYGQQPMGLNAHQPNPAPDLKARLLGKDPQYGQQSMGLNAHQPNPAQDLSSRLGKMPPNQHAPGVRDSSFVSEPAVAQQHSFKPSAVQPGYADKGQSPVWAPDKSQTPVPHPGNQPPPQPRSSPITPAQRDSLVAQAQPGAIDADMQPQSFKPKAHPRQEAFSNVPRPSPNEPVTQSTPGYQKPGMPTPNTAVSEAYNNQLMGERARGSLSAKGQPSLRKPDPVFGPEMEPLSQSAKAPSSLARVQGGPGQTIGEVPRPAAQSLGMAEPDASAAARQEGYAGRSQMRSQARTAPVQGPAMPPKAEAPSLSTPGPVESAPASSIGRAQNTSLRDRMFRLDQSKPTNPIGPFGDSMPQGPNAIDQARSANKPLADVQRLRNPAQEAPAAPEGMGSRVMRNLPAAGVVAEKAYDTYKNPGGALNKWKNEYAADPAKALQDTASMAATFPGAAPVALPVSGGVGAYRLLRDAKAHKDWSTEHSRPASPAEATQFQNTQNKATSATSGMPRPEPLGKIPGLGFNPAEAAQALTAPRPAAAPAKPTPPPTSGGSNLVFAPGETLSSRQQVANQAPEKPQASPVSAGASGAMAIPKLNSPAPLFNEPPKMLGAAGKDVGKGLNPSLAAHNDAVSTEGPMHQKWRHEQMGGDTSKTFPELQVKKPSMDMASTDLTKKRPFGPPGSAGDDPSKKPEKKDDSKKPDEKSDDKKDSKSEKKPEKKKSPAKKKAPVQVAAAPGAKVASYSLVDMVVERFSTADDFFTTLVGDK